MKKDFYEDKENFSRQSNANLAAAYNILHDLSDDEFESWLEGGNVSPAKYAEAERKFLAQPISEKIADLKRRAKAKTQLPPKNVGLVQRLKNVLFTNLLLLEPAIAVEFCGDTDVEPPEQRTMNLCEWFEENELDRKLPWASHSVVIMKSPIKDKPGMVRYRIFMEKYKSGKENGTLYIFLQAGQHIDKVRLGRNQRSKTFLKTVLPADMPVSFTPTLE